MWSFSRAPRCKRCTEESLLIIEKCKIIIIEGWPVIDNVCCARRWFFKIITIEGWPVIDKVCCARSWFIRYLPPIPLWKCYDVWFEALVEAEDLAAVRSGSAMASIGGCCLSSDGTIVWSETAAPPAKMSYSIIATIWLFLPHDTSIPCRVIEYIGDETCASSVR